MSIEDTLSSHYRTVEVDVAARQRLQSVIADLSGEPDRPAPRRLVAAGVTVLALAGCVAAVAAADAVWVSHSRDAAADLAAPGPVRVTNTGPGLPYKAGFVGVVNARGITGLIRQSDADDAEERVTSAASAYRLDAARQHLTVVLALFDPTGRQVIGEWNTAGASAVLPISCPDHDGIAFHVAATHRPGHRTPTQAARNLDRDLSLANFGSSHTIWTVSSRTATTATLNAATTTLHATSRSDRTWVITSGQRCTT